jgi:hypothetical protein
MIVLNTTNSIKLRGIGEGGFFIFMSYFIIL